MIAAAATDCILLSRDLFRNGNMRSARRGRNFCWWGKLARGQKRELARGSEARGSEALRLWRIVVHWEDCGRRIV